MDAAHFVHAAFLGYLWCFARIFIKSPSGRQRLNVLGALNAITKELVLFTNVGYINADCVCQLLNDIKAKSVDLPITVILDNARYQHCELVKNCAELLGIELLFLPTYSPNLNLIERLWRFVKKEALYSKYYETFSDFKEGIIGCLNEVTGEHKDALATLLSLKFQTFNKAQIIAA